MFRKKTLREIESHRQNKIHRKNHFITLELFQNKIPLLERYAFYIKTYLN